MSQAREDWKYFEQVSDTMRIGDLTSPSVIEVRNVSTGKWAAFCIYDENNRIERVLLASMDIMEKFDSDGKLKLLRSGYFGYEDEAKANAGIFYVFDKSHMNEYQTGYDSHFDPETIEKWGRPDDEAKSASRQFIELACHLTKFRDMDMLETANFGAFFRAHSDIELGFLRERKSGKVKLIEAIAK